MSSIALVAVDLDSTLLISEGTLAERGAALLQRAASEGIHVIIATTRNPPFVQHLCQTLDINDPIICTNGAQVWASPEGPVWAYHAIPRDTALEIARLADENDWELATTIGSVTYLKQRPDQSPGPLSEHLLIVPTNVEQIVDDPVRILANHADAIERIETLVRTTLSAHCRTDIFYRSDGTKYSLAVFAPQADKGAALDLVTKRLGVEQNQILAIGDNFNDLPMFARAGISVAMGNATEPIKQAASAVAPTNDDEGVAWALETFVFNQ